MKLQKSYTKASTKTQPPVASPAGRPALDLLESKVHRVRPGVLGIDKETEAPSVPNFDLSVNAKPLRIDASEIGTGRG